MKYDSRKYIRMALENGYTQDLKCSYIRNDDKRYSLIILSTFVCLIYDADVNECEGIATSRESDGSGTIYRYMGVPADILMDIAIGPVGDIRKKLYEYDVNRSLEVLG